MKSSITSSLLTATIATAFSLSACSADSSSKGGADASTGSGNGGGLGTGGATSTGGRAGGGGLGTGGATSMGGSAGGGGVGRGGATSTGGSADSGAMSSVDGGKLPASRCAPDESAPVPAGRCTTDPNNTTVPQCNKWLKVEIPGTVCGDGSQYKFFVNYSDKSNDLVVDFEPGGACWDYPSCAGTGGIRGAANPHGIPDDHMTTYQFLNLLQRTDQNPAKDYNMVFLSYCTGDIHTGNNVITYTDTDGYDGGSSSPGNSPADAGPALTFHHAGHANTMAVIDWMKKTFGTVPKMLVTGCSAGGAGAIINYHFVRKGMGNNVQCSYLLDDSGPIFHSDGPSAQLDAKVRSAWNVDPILDSLGAELPISAADIKKDFGLLNKAIAEKYSSDRLALTLFRMDLNYSLYSYQRFFPNQSEADIHAKWWQDIQSLLPTYDAEPNLFYYIPYFRSDNCSHCVSIPPIGNPPIEPLDQTKALTQSWSGSEIPEDHVDLKQFTADLLDDPKPLRSYLQQVEPNESFAPAVSAACMEGG